MDLPPHLIAELVTLAELSTDPGADLPAHVHNVTQAVRAAVPSFQGLRVTVVVQGYPFTTTVVDEGAAPVGASVALRLRPTTPAAAADSAVAEGVVVVFYAATPGAFVDLAADAARVLGPAPGTVVLDPHLDEPDATYPVSGLTGMAEISLINQAIGFLIGRGYTPDQARAVLTEGARTTGTNTVEAARAVLDAPAPGS